MTVNPQEVLASLQLLAWMAKADGVLQEEEREVLQQILNQVQSLPEGITPEQLFNQEIHPEETLAKIQTPLIQEKLYQAAQMMAYAGGMSPESQAFLHHLQQTFQLDGQILLPPSPGVETGDTEESPVVATVILDTEERKQAVRQLILDYAIGVSILGFNPFPGLNVITTLAAYGLIFKMMRDIGAKWGHPKGQDALAIIGNLFGGIGAFIAALATATAVAVVGVLIPVLGSFTAASYYFTITWALGRVTDQYYASGQQMDLSHLKQAFQAAKAEGKSQYQVNESAIVAKRQATKGQLKQLGEEVQTGKLTPEEYQTQVEHIL